jgi:hypothetical protein
MDSKSKRPVVIDKAVSLVIAGFLLGAGRNAGRAQKFCYAAADAEPSPQL